MSGATRFGLTWWGKRWISALEALGALYANRLPRGRTYARKGTVNNLVVDAGEVRAFVQGSRAAPYHIRLRLPAFDEPTWEAVTAALASRLRLSAELLDGRMPEDIDEVLFECGVSLFPTARELVTRCSCPDAANPCKHVAAVHYVLAQSFDADPFLLTALRGRDRDTLLAALRAHRAGTDEVEDDAPAARGPMPIEQLVARDLFASPGGIDEVTVRPQPPDDPAAVLRRLGAPPGLETVMTALEGAVTDAAGVAWELLDGDGDPVTAVLRRLGPTSARELADELGAPIEDVRVQLRELREQGRITVSGRGPATRYRLER